MGWGGQGRCEQRSEVFAKIKKKYVGRGSVWGGGRVGGVRVDVIEELKFLGKFTKKKKKLGESVRGVRVDEIKELKFSGGGGGGGGGGGVGLGVRVDVNEELTFFWKFQNKIIFWGGGGLRGVGSRGGGLGREGGGGSGWWGGGSWWM